MIIIVLSITDLLHDPYHALGSCIDQSIDLDRRLRRSRWPNMVM